MTMGTMMGSPHRNTLIGIAAVALLLGLGAWWYTAQPASYDFEFVAGEEVVSWNFQGAYTGNPELEARAEAEIGRLKGLFGQEGYTDYELYISIANQYGLLGDGKGEYDYLTRALAIDSEATGLAWHNMGKLLERLGALKTARIAYDNMVKAQPVIQYQTERLEFLRAYMPEDTEAIAEAEAQLQGTAGEFILE